MDLVCSSSGVSEGDYHDSWEMQEGIVEEKGFRDVVKLRTSPMGGCTEFEEAFGEGEKEFLSSTYAWYLGRKSRK